LYLGSGCSEYKEESKVRNTKKLQLKKVTLRNLDEPMLNEMAGGITGTCLETLCIACATVTVGEKICATCPAGVCK
jgi:hypothetical protein